MSDDKKVVVINVVDPDEVADMLGSPQTERAILDIIRRHRDGLREALK